MFKNCPQWKSQQKTLWATVLDETKNLPGPNRGRDRTKIAELFADERCIFSFGGVENPKVASQGSAWTDHIQVCLTRRLQEII